MIYSLPSAGANSIWDVPNKLPVKGAVGGAAAVGGEGFCRDGRAAGRDHRPAMPAYAQEEAARLDAALARFAASADSLRSHHATHGQASGRAKKLSAALMSTDEQKSQRQTEHLLSSLRPHLEQTEQRLVSKIEEATTQRFGPEPEPEPEPQPQPQPEPPGSPLEDWGGDEAPASPMKLLQGCETRGERINPLEPSWVPRTVYIGGIEMHEAEPDYIKAVVDKVATRQATAVTDGGVHSPGIVVGVSVRQKEEERDGSWALVSFSTQEAAKRLLEEQQKDVEHRCTGTEWHFLPFDPDRLGSYEARRALFSVMKDTVNFAVSPGGTGSSLVRHAVKRFKESHLATKEDRTVWVGDIPDRIAREVSDSCERRAPS